MHWQNTPAVMTVVLGIMAEKTQRLAGGYPERQGGLVKSLTVLSPEQSCFLGWRRKVSETCYLSSCI